MDKDTYRIINDIIQQEIDFNLNYVVNSFNNFREDSFVSNKKIELNNLIYIQNKIRKVYLKSIIK